MGTVKTYVSIQGDKSSRDGLALVDTGATITVVDVKVAEEVGCKHTGRRRSLVTASGHKLEGELVIFKKFKVEGEVLDYERALAVKIPIEVKNALESGEVANWIIIGLITLESAGYIPDTTTGKLRKTETLLL